MAPLAVKFGHQLSLLLEPQPVIVVLIIYLNYLEARMCMNTSNLFMQKSKSDSCQ